MESSGGDGIYLGSTSAHPYCEEVIIHDVICRDHHRQGISVISAVNLLIEDCVLSDTDGTAPEAGIDLEPNSSNEKFVNVVVRNCRMENNSGAGILLYPVNLNEESEPLSIRFERCTIKGGKDAGIGIGGLKDNGPKGTVEFIECSVEDTDKCGAYIYDKSPDAALVRFVKCTWKNVARKDPKSEFRVPLMLHAFRKKYAQTQGGVEFSDCFVFDNHTRPVFSVKSDKGARKVNGTIRVENPKGVRAELPAVMTESSMKVIDVHERH